MNVNLGTVFDKFIGELLKTGMYQSQSEVVREGLRLLKEREELKKLRLAELRKEIAIGSEQADRGEFVLDDIWDYIADDNIEAADRVLDALENTMVKLAKNPRIGHWREDLTDKRHRFFLVYSYLIVYRHETKPLQIIRVLHAARDVQGILGLSPDES